MRRGAELRRFADEHGLPFVSIADLIRFRRRTERLITRTAAARLPTTWGESRRHPFQSVLDGETTWRAFWATCPETNRCSSRAQRGLTGDVFGSVNVYDVTVNGLRQR